MSLNQIKISVWTKIKCLFFVICTCLMSCSCSTTLSTSEQSANELAQRLLSDKSSLFIFKHIPSNSDFFELEQVDGKIQITGNNGVSMARGLNYYLREYCHLSVSDCGNNILKFPNPIPVIPRKIKIDASFQHRYYLNYCTYSYSMAFWGWEQWEKEIDRMALQGINMPLAGVYSQYAVWQNTLRRLNFNEKEILDFLPGPGYEAWWLMGNLEGFGGPVSQKFITKQTCLQQKIIKRMKELGMKPVFQGFYGMVPNSLKKKFPDANIKDQGLWLTYQRPAFLDPTDPLFEKIATIFYEEQNKLFGDAQFFGGDPFHEGGTKEGIDVKQAASKIMQSMKKINPDAVWVLQGWQNNPSKELLSGLQNNEAIILDFAACERTNSEDVKSSASHYPEGFMNHKWIWCVIPNFGGKTGLYGKMSRYASDPVLVKDNPVGKNLSGIGTASEGIGTIPVVYDMIYDMAWRKDSIDIQKWLSNYAFYRYGIDDINCKKAWSILSKTIYDCHNSLGGPVESYICARPSDVIKSVSTWGNAEMFYNPMCIVNAWSYMFQSRDKLRNSDTYEYDLTDITRQVLSDYAKYLHKEMVNAFREKNIITFSDFSDKFLTLIKDEDKLLSTRKEFMLGTWLSQAEDAGCTPQDKQQFVMNAKRQITTWSGVSSDLHDYANKEWSGLLIDFYLPRWEAYVSYKKGLLNGKKVNLPDYPKMEKKWVLKNSIYPTKVSKEGAINTIEWIYKKYYADIKRAYQIYEMCTEN